MDTRIAPHAVPIAPALSSTPRAGEPAEAAAAPGAGAEAPPLIGAHDAVALARDLQRGIKPSERALAQLNDFLKSQQQQLEFSMDKATNRIVLRVIDTSSGQVIRQVPTEDWLHLAQTLSSGGRGGALLQDQA